MTEFYSPYQFIPVDLNKTKKTPWKKGETLDANDYVRHDRWVKDSISATITCRITTLTPLAVGREQGDSTEQKPAEVTPYSYENRPAIPANSLRGMIGSIAETLSQSAMRVLMDKKDSEQRLRFKNEWRSIGNTYQGIKKILGKDAVPWNSEREYLTPAEALFGVIEETTEKDPEKRRNLASRLHFTDAIANEGVSFSKDWITLKKLDSPKPPSPAMYYSAANGSFISKEKIDLKKHKPNGRKHYLPQAEINKKSITPWKTDPQYSSADTHKEGSWKQHLRIKPVPEQSVFIFKIKGENLSPDEFGLLLTSLEPALINDDFVHRLGMGKPYGLGQIRLDIDGIEQVNRPQRYSLSGLKSERSSAYKDDKKTRNTKLIDTTAWRELQTLANPKYSADHPVCYPFTTGQKAYSEEKGFQWFVNNEKPKGKGERDYLRKITIDESLRPLKSN